MKNIAVQGCTLKITDPTLTGAPQFAPGVMPSQKAKAGGKSVYKGDLSVIIPTVTDTAGNVAAGVTLTISGSSKKTKVEGAAAALEKDSGKATAVTFTHPSSGATATHDVEVEISAAGQSKTTTE